MVSAALAGFAPLNRSLTQATLRRARRQSRWYKALAVVEWLAFAGSFLYITATSTSDWFRRLGWR